MLIHQFDEFPVTQHHISQKRQKASLSRTLQQASTREEHFDSPPPTYSNATIEHSKVRRVLLQHPRFYISTTQRSSQHSQHPAELQEGLTALITAHIEHVGKHLLTILCYSLKQVFP